MIFACLFEMDFRDLWELYRTLSSKQNIRKLNDELKVATKSLEKVIKKEEGFWIYSKMSVTYRLTPVNRCNALS